jgi:hypothetical protein
MSSYEIEHASFAEEERKQRQRQEQRHQAQGRAPSRLSRSEPLLATFFSPDRVAVQPSAFADLANALRQHGAVDSSLMESMIEQLLTEARGTVEGSGGVDQTFLDTLDRVSKKALRADDACPICATMYIEDKYSLIVQLRCKHRFDLECITPWLKLHTTCPMCRAEVQTPKTITLANDSEEEYDNTYG